MAKPLDFSGTNPVGTPSSMDVFNSANQAISFTEQLPDLTQKLREALMTKFSTNNPLFAQRETAQQQFLNAPSQARADISQMQQGGTILSPTQQEAITSSRRSAAFAPLSSANLMLGSAYGGMEGIIKSGTDAFTAAAESKTKQANLLNELRKQEMDRMFKEKELQLQYAKLGSSQSKTASKELQKQQDALRSINEALSAIQNARNSLSTGGAGTWFAGLRKKLPRWMGGISEKASNLDSALATVNKSLFETAGKAFTKTEADILGGRVPLVSYQPNIIENTLDELERDLLTRQLGIMTRQYNLPETGETGSSEWELVF
jgi:hypothetical protein